MYLKKAGGQIGQTADTTKLVSPNNNIQYFKEFFFPSSENEPIETFVRGNKESKN